MNKQLDAIVLSLNTKPKRTRMGASEIAAWAKVLNEFKNSGCTDASKIATMFCALVDKWDDKGTLPRCWPKLSDVFNYP